MKKTVLVLAVISAGVSRGWAADAIDDLGLEDLLKAEVTSVSRKSQSLADVPAAAFVISSDDIRRSGAQALPDVLRMVPGLEVAQIDSGRYAVSARGFNGRFANKLQVLVDGRSIYHPIFSGVIWENDQIPLEDIERVEVLRGPGAGMWGANAVNGVINIITKHSKNQQGSAVSATVSSNSNGTLYARQGGRLDEGTTWKLSAQGRHAEPSTEFATGRDSEDRMNNAVVDFRFDKDLGDGRDLSVWANASHSSLGDLWQAVPRYSSTTMRYTGLGYLPIEQNYTNNSLMGRYRWLSDSGVESSIQLAFTSLGLEVKTFLDEQRKTFDLDYQGRYAVKNHDLLWGISHRTSSDTIDTTEPYISFRHPEFTQRSTGLFVHDDWALIPERLTLGMGVRWDTSNLGGETLSPNASLMWTPTRSDTLWAKYARAPRMPTRAESDVSLYISAMEPSAQTRNLPVFVRVEPGKSSLKPEQLEGVELGYRKQVSATVNVDVAAYRYRYTDLRSGSAGSSSLAGSFPIFWIEQTTPTCNCMSGWSSGFELSTDWLVTPAWRMQLSYSWINLQLDKSDDPSVQENAESYEKGGPRHYASLRSQWNVSSSQQLDAWIRASAGFERVDAPLIGYVHVPGYATLDLRYGYKVNKDLELALSGRNLIGPRRTEYVSDYLPSVPVEVKPSLVVTMRWKF